MSNTVRSSHYAKSQLLDESQRNENLSNVKIYCRIRPPAVSGNKSLTRRIQNDYAALRNKSRSTSKNKSLSSPLRHHSSVIQTARESSRNIKSPSQRGNSTQRSTSLSQKLGTVDGRIQSDKVYSMFTPRNPSQFVICTEDGIEGRIINEQITDISDLKYLKQYWFQILNSKGTLGNEAIFTFEFDQVLNETTRQDKFYAQTIKPAVKSFIEGENGSVLLFGPTNGGKTFTLKGKTGIDRGVLPRAIEDIFSIIKASHNEDLEEFYDNESDKDRENIGHISNRRDQFSFQDRTFLKVSIYQILSDRILDLLSSQKHQHKKVYIDHILDEKTQEVIGKLRNITEKVILNQEDFYTYLQQAFQTRRIESVNSQNNDLRQKSHMVISLTMMQRSQGKLKETSQLNFVELSGSEQAVKQENQFVNTTIRNFVTKSFNGLSSQLLKSIQRKKGQGTSEGDNPLLDCLRKTLTHKSNIVLICNVNPSPNHFEHSLPAVKFCAKIRDSILKKLTHSHRKHVDFSQKNNQYRGQVNLTQEIKKIITDLKEEMAARQISELREEFTTQDYNRWSTDQLSKIQKVRNLLDQNPFNIQEQDQYHLLNEVKYLRDQIEKMKPHQPSHLQTPQQPYNYLRESYSIQSPRELAQNLGIQPITSQYSSAYNPYKTTSYNNYEIRNTMNRSIQDPINNQQLIYTDEPQPLRGLCFDSQQQSLQKLRIGSRDPKDISCYSRERKPSIKDENDFLNQLNPLVGQSLSGQKRNSLSPDVSPDIQNQQTAERGFRQAPTHHGVFQTTQNQLTNTKTQISTLSPQRNPFNQLSQQHSTLKQKLENSLRKSLMPMKHPDKHLNALDQLKHSYVYQTEQEAHNDLQRLFKLGDLDGLKLRITQMMKERESIQQIGEDLMRDMNVYRENLENREKIMIEQDQIIKDMEREHLNQVENLSQKQKDHEVNTLLQSQSIGDHLKDLQLMIKVLQEDKEKLIDQKSTLDQDNKNCIKLKEEAEAKQKTLQEENDKLKKTYEILKEHELNIIKDTEDRKKAEVAFYESRMLEIQQEQRSMQSQMAEIEGKMFNLKEELKKADYENVKLQDDNDYLKQSIQDLRHLITAQDEEKLELQGQIKSLEQECHRLECQRDQMENEKNQAKSEISKLHLLVEKMEQKITELESIRTEDRDKQSQLMKQIENQELEKVQLKQIITDRENQINQGFDREESLKLDNKTLSATNEKLDRTLTLMKAKEYDKVDVLKKAAELEAKCKYLNVDNETLSKERNQLDLQVVTLNRENQEIQQQLMMTQQELDFLRQANEEHLDKFDNKFSEITLEVTKIKNENLQLKEKEKTRKLKIKEVEQELQEAQGLIRRQSKEKEEMRMQMQELESEIRGLLSERERERRDLELKAREEQRSKEETRGIVLGDIHNMIKCYKDEKKLSKSGYISQGANAYSTNSSALY